jgi:formate-dependent nitrite reductase membrane component NrfD
MTTMQELTTTRSNALIDPALHIWHGEVAAYLFLGGLVAGVMVLAGLSLLGTDRDRPSRHLALLPWSAPILLSAGMFFLWLDLENPWNAFRFYLVFRPGSPLSWGSWILLAIYPASLALAWRTTPLEMRGWVVERLGRRWSRGGEREWAARQGHISAYFSGAAVQAADVAAPPPMARAGGAKPKKKGGC